MAEVASRQHGVIALWHLAELGLTSSGVRNRIASGRLHALHRGVYAVSHARLTREGRLMAAVLAWGRGAALSHRSAAAHLGLRQDNRAGTDVTSPGRRGRTMAAIIVHSGATLLARDVEIVDDIACTTVARTLLDLADVVPIRQLERAIERAEADFLWHAQRLIVEVDGRAVHTTRHAFEHDRRRDQRLMLLGRRVVRFTWHQVLHQPATVAATVNALLSSC